MSDNQSPELLKEKLARAQKAKAILTERSKQLQQQLEDFRSREETMAHVASELLERQRELNFMLHRASSVLHQLQDTNVALSAEFTQLAKELPAPQDSDWDSTMSRVNDLFQKTHELAGEMQEEIFLTTSDFKSPGQDSRTMTETAKEEASPSTSDASTEAQATELEQEIPDQPTEIRDAEFHSTDDEAQPEVRSEELSPEEAEITEQEILEEDNPADDLFNKINCDEYGRIKKPVRDENSDSEEKQGLLSKLLPWRGKSE